MHPVWGHHLKTALDPIAEFADVSSARAAFARAVRYVVRAPIRVELCGRQMQRTVTATEPTSPCMRTHRA